ncbi:MAG: methyltransferase domain-containing protein [Xanthomonadales bacterium]|nr:methyltransferase domain-containing protein [Xanthomonadales bacterium]
MTTSARFWDRIADRYSRKPVPDETIYQQKLKITRQLMHPNMEVVEFGAGTGSTALAHAPHVRHILATDVSPRMMEIARGKAAAAGIDNVRFEVSSVEELAVAAESVDLVLGLSILHLLEDRDAAITKVWDMLRPGGYFVSSTPCLGDWFKLFKLVGPVGHFFGVIPMVKVFTRKELDDSLSNAGFTIEHAWQPERKQGVFIVARKPA